jgi:glucose-6-phosphate isomerase
MKSKTPSRSTKTLANDFHTGKIRGEKGAFKNLRLIGIGGSTLGPQFDANVLGDMNYDNILSYILVSIDNTLSSQVSLVGKTA